MLCPVDGDYRVHGARKPLKMNMICTSIRKSRARSSQTGGMDVQCDGDEYPGKLRGKNCLDYFTRTATAGVKKLCCKAIASIDKVRVRAENWVQQS